jgi:hypothetical protein
MQGGGTNCMPGILEIASQNPEFTLSTTLIKRANLAGIFMCPGPFTALLPTNAAWDALDPMFLEFILRPENAQLLADILLYNILAGAHPSSQLVPGPIQTLLPGGQVTVSVNPIMFNNATGVGSLDISACNGLIDGISAVLLPFAPRKLVRDVSRPPCLPCVERSFSFFFLSYCSAELSPSYAVSSSSVFRPSHAVSFSSVFRPSHADSSSSIFLPSHADRYSSEFRPSHADSYSSEFCPSHADSSSSEFSPSHADSSSSEFRPRHAGNYSSNFWTGSISDRTTCSDQHSGGSSKSSTHVGLRYV